MNKPTKNPYAKKSQEFKLWNRGYDHGLKNSTNKVLVDCPVQKTSTKEVQLIWDKGFVAGRKDQKSIPKGQYCYSPRSIVKESNGQVAMKVKPCPFYSQRKTKDQNVFSIGTMGICRLTRTVDDALLADQCKVCGVKND